MAFRKFFGNAKKNDKGEWIDIGHEPDNPSKLVRAQVRRVSQVEHQKLAENLGTLEKVVNKTNDGNEFWAKQRIMSLEDVQTLQRGIGCGALIDTENYSVTPGDEEMVAILKRMARNGAELDVAVDKPVTLDGRWTEDLKTYIFIHDTEFLDAVITGSRKLGEKIDKIEKTQLGNS